MRYAAGMSLDSAPVRRSQLVSGAQPAELYAVITDFEAYPRLFREVKSVRVLERDGTRVRVEFKLDLMVAVRYVLDLVCDSSALTVDWTYVEGEVVTRSQGSWRFVPQPGGTRLDYQVELAINAPLPGFVVRRLTDALVSASLPSMFSARAKPRVSPTPSGSSAPINTPSW